MYFRQHRTIASAGFDGSFPPQIRCEKFEIHKVFLHFHNKFVMKNPSSNLLAQLCGIALNESLHQNNQNQNGQDELEVGLQPLLHFDADTGIGFLEVVVRAPAPLGDAEQ